MVDGVDFLSQLVQMYGVRKPYKGELDFFKKRPEVAGMATEDNKIILNPFSKNSTEEQAAVAKNEALRLYMKANELNPDFDLTPKQQKLFAGTEYEKEPQEAKKSIISRILTGDPSIGTPSEKQIQYANDVMKQIQSTIKPTMPDEYRAGGRVTLI